VALAIYSPLALPRAIEVEGGTDECEVAEGLRRIAELLAGPRDLLGEHGQVVREAQHVLEDVDGQAEVLGLVYAGARHGLDQPEGAHGESALAAADAWETRVS
jgi:hypothetical protein